MQADNLNSCNFFNLIRPGGYLAINKNLIKALGIQNAFILSDLMDKYVQFYEAGTLDENGGFYYELPHRIKTWCISESTQRRQIRQLESLGVIGTEVKGNARLMFFYLHLEAIKELIWNGSSNQDEDFHPVNLTGSNSQIERKLYIDKEQILITESESGKTVSKRTKAPIEDVPKKENKEEPFLPFAEMLASIIQTKKRIKTDPAKIRTWAKSFYQLASIERVSPARMKKALEWYAENIGGPYIPVVESGASFREKFLRIEAQMERLTEAECQEEPEDEQPTHTRWAPNLGEYREEL